MVEHDAILDLHTSWKMYTRFIIYNRKANFLIVVTKVEAPKPLRLSRLEAFKTDCVHC